MKPGAEIPNGVVYLLHWTTTQPTPWHYVGRTTWRRLRARMREHANGDGSDETAAAVAAGFELCLAALWHMPHTSLEATIRAIQARQGLCPVCAGAVPIARFRCRPRPASLNLRPAWEPFAIAPPQDWTPPRNRKRQGRLALPLPFSGVRGS